MRGPLPRLARALTAEAIHLSAGPSPEDPSTHVTDIQVVDLGAQGYAGEAGNFIARCATAPGGCAAARLAARRCVAELPGTRIA